MSTATIDPHSIASIVRQVIAEIGQPSAAAAPVAGPVAGGSLAGANGVFSSVDEAVRAATDAFEQL